MKTKWCSRIAMTSFFSVSCQCFPELMYATASIYLSVYGAKVLLLLEQETIIKAPLYRWVHLSLGPNGSAQQFEVDNGVV